MTDTRRLAAIMFVDMVGYTASSQADESGTIRRVHDVNARLQPIIAAAGGRRIKSTGDGLLVEFESALRASECAVEIQRRLHESGWQGSGPPAQLRIGVHLGDVEEHDDDILGDAVNIAARIEPLAEPGGVSISGEVYAQIRGKTATRWELTPPKELKGIKHAVSVYRALLPWEDPAATASGQDRNRIAVLPFANFSPDAHDEYFADGLTEEMITVLAKIPDLRVIARTSVFPYKGTQKSMGQIGSELGVSTILEGSVRKAGDRIRITAQLIDVSTQAHRWAETYDRKLEDVFAVQTDVATEVAKALEVRLGHGEDARLPASRPVAAESYLEYLRGRAIMTQSQSESSLKEAQELFEQALALDPKNARAAAALSEATHLMGLFHRRETRTVSDAKARELADRAIGLDPNLADGHSALGLILYSSCEWAAAEREALLALSLNPSFSDVRVWYSLMLAELGRGEESLREMSLAFESDPQSRVVAGLLVILLLWLRRFDEAKVVLDRYRLLDSEGRLYHLDLALYHLLQGNNDLALAEAAKGDSLVFENGYAGPSVIRAIVLARVGQLDEALRILRTIESLAAVRGSEEAMALAYALMGRLDESFRILELKMATGTLGVQMFRLEPLAEPIRKDPRFAEILKKMRLAE